MSLGSNILPEENLPRAIQALGEQSQVLALSSIWKGPAVGAEAPDFLNAAAEVATTHLAATFEKEVLAPIENALGRVRTKDKFAPRTIDLDLIIFDDNLLDPKLWELDYLLLPFAEIRPYFAQPDSGQTLAKLAEQRRGYTLLSKWR